MLKGKKKYHLTQLLTELKQLKMEAQQDIPVSTTLSVPSDNEVLQQIVQSINDIVDIYQKKYEALATKHEIVTELNGIGTWDGEIYENSLTGDTKITYNQTFRNALGYEDESDFPEILDSWHDTVSPKDLERVITAYQQFLENGIPYDIEYRSVNKDNTTEWVHMRAKALRDKDGNLYRHIGTLMNIHESKSSSLQVQQLLSKLEMIERSLNLATDSFEGVWGTHLASNGTNEENTWYSPQFKRLLGFADSDYCKPTIDTWMNMIVPEERDIISKQLNRHLYETEKTTVNLDFRLITKDGTSKWFSMLVRTLRDAAGHPTLLSGVLRDIDHDIKRLQDNEQISNNMSNFAVTINELAENIQAISKEATDLARENKRSLISSQTAKENIESTKAVTHLIKTISDQTHLLGINASIEASIAGEHGKGFKVVAGEIQKLSTNTAEAVEQIDQILESIKHSVLQIVASVDTMSGKIQHQAVVTQDIEQATKSINKHSTELVGLIQQLD